MKAVKSEQGWYKDNENLIEGPAVRVEYDNGDVVIYAEISLIGCLVSAEKNDPNFTAY